jgi:signal transduction histidine kinase
MAGSADFSASAAAMSRYERRLRTMTRAVLLADNRRTALTLVAARACQAASADIGAVFVRDADGDEAVLSPSGRSSRPKLTALMARLLDGARSKPALMDVPELALGGAMASGVVAARHVRGVLVVARKAAEKPYVEADLNLLAPFAAEAGLAITFAEARRELERGLLAKDRDRIARELHDGVIQALYGIGMVVEGIKAETFQPGVHEQLSVVTASINGIMDDLRAYIHDLTPARLAKRGLGPELCALAAEFQSASGVVASVRLHDGVEEIKAAMGRDIVQIAREALSNVAKHAAATRVVLSLRCTAQSIKLEITDDGRGIAVRRTSSGRGLANIVRRAQAWGGSAEISAAGASGTTVRVVLPLRAAEAPATASLAIAG